MKAKEVAERFAGMNPDDDVWITYITKDDVKETCSDLELTDDNDNLIETDQFVNDEVLRLVITSLDNDDYLWERFNENFREACVEAITEQIETAKEDEELWDMEGEASESK